MPHGAVVDGLYLFGPVLPAVALDTLVGIAVEGEDAVAELLDGLVVAIKVDIRSIRLAVLDNRRFALRHVAIASCVHFDLRLAIGFALDRGKRE